MIVTTPQDMRAHRGMLPERLFLGCGTKEYSATRDHVRDDVDGLLLHYCCEAASILQSQVRSRWCAGGVREGGGSYSQPPGGGRWSCRMPLSYACVVVRVRSGGAATL